MQKKTLIQTVLLFLILLITVSFYQSYLQIKPEITKNEINDNQEVGDGNLIKDLSYFSKDINENTYLLKAKTGSTDKENPNLIKLYDVRAIIDFNKKNEIMVTSREAIYNNITYDTKFIGNVLIEFESQTITCDNMNAKLSENIAIISGNIIYKNEFSQFYADKIEFDLLDKSSKITMFDKNEKIKINYKKDGFN